MSDGPLNLLKSCQMERRKTFSITNSITFHMISCLIISLLTRTEQLSWTNESGGVHETYSYLVLAYITSKKPFQT